MHYSVTGRLHTDLLEDVYGPISIQVLNDDNHTREVLLTDKHHIARTYALTSKTEDWVRNPEMQVVNAAISAGDAIGQAFRAHGFAICKNIIDVYVMDIPEWLQYAFEHESRVAKARVSEFLVKKDQLIFSYGVITEIYSPDFRPALVNAEDLAQVNLPTEVLFGMGFTRQQVWNFIQRKAAPLPALHRIQDKVRQALQEGEQFGAYLC